MRRVPSSLNWTGGMSERSSVFILSVTPSSSIRTLLVAGKHTCHIIDFLSVLLYQCTLILRTKHIQDNFSVWNVLELIYFDCLGSGSLYQEWQGFWVRLVQHVEQTRLLHLRAAPTMSGCEEPLRGPASSHSYCLTEKQQAQVLKTPLLKSKQTLTWRSFGAFLSTL